MSELYKEHKTAVEIQNNTIKVYKNLLTQARSKGCYRDVKHLHSILRVLYAEKSELIERCEGLRKYVSEK